MSVRLMSAVFCAELGDGESKDGRTVRSPVLKAVALALADHANDEGEGAYPGLTSLEVKTGLTRKTVIRALQALSKAGAVRRGGRSKFETVVYTLSPEYFTERRSDRLPGRMAKAGGVLSTLPKRAGGVLGTPVGGVLGTPESPSNREREEAAAPVTEETRHKVFAAFETHFGVMSPIDHENVLDALSRYKPNTVAQAIEVARKNGAKSWAYVDKVLRGWQTGDKPKSEARARTRTQEIPIYD